MRMREILFTKLKAISHRLCIQVHKFILLFQELDCSILEKLEREPSFPFNKKYFIFLEWF